MALSKVVRDVFVVAAKRTPFGAYGGSLATKTAIDLQEIAFSAALTSGQVKPEHVDSVVVGNVFYATSDGPYLARHAALRVGIPDVVPAHIVNRMCGSGFQSIITASQEIELGLSGVVLTGGSDTMSMAPHSVHGARFGAKLGQDLKMEDTLWQGLIDHHVKTPMGVTAENLAAKYSISREETDAFSLQSQQRWKSAHDSGIFTAEMAPITMKSKKGEKIFDTDEHPRPNVTLDQMARLPPVFKKGGVVTAASSSGICDGAGAVILASGDSCKKHGYTPLAKLTAYAISGCDPTIMGIGPVSATKALLSKTGKKIDDIDLVEVNEAFAAQYLAVASELCLDPAKTNVNGGAIAIGHPVGASGSRITAHLVHQLKHTGKKSALGSACIGGGQGISILLEAM